jgi:hypothetical protein
VHAGRVRDLPELRTATDGEAARFVIPDGWRGRRRAAPPIRATPTARAA